MSHPDCLPCEIKRLRRRVDELLRANSREVEQRRAAEQRVRELEKLQFRKKLLIVGYGRHGKDTVAEILRDHHGFRFVSSSYFCAERVMMPFFDQFGPEGRQVPGFDDRWFRSYSSVEECFNDRHNFRDVWHQQIAAWNSDDPTKLSREILEVADIYVGMRSIKEYEAAKHLYNEVWWVDATGRGLSPEDQSSMNLVFVPHEMRRIENNGSLEDLHRTVAKALKNLG